MSIRYRLNRAEEAIVGEHQIAGVWKQADTRVIALGAALGRCACGGTLRVVDGLPRIFGLRKYCFKCGREVTK